MKKVYSLIFAISLLCTGINANSVYSASDIEITKGSEVNIVSGQNSFVDVAENKAITNVGSNTYLVDLGRPYDIETIDLYGASGASVTVSNDPDFGASLAEKTEIINVAKDKRIYSTRFGAGGYLSHVSMKANDGDENTSYISTPLYHTDDDSLIVDLEKEYKIEYITLNADNRRPKTVYVSKDASFSNPVKLSSFLGRYYMPNAYKNEKYRYAKAYFGSGSKGEQKDFYVYEFQVFSYEVTQKAAPSMTNNCVYENGVYKPTDDSQHFRYLKVSGADVNKISAFVKSENAGSKNLSETAKISAHSTAIVWGDYPLENAIDNNPYTNCALNCSAAYVQLDFGRAKSIETVELRLRNDMLSDREEIEILASNDPNFGEYFVIAKQDNNEKIGINASFVRVNKNTLEGFRYLRVYEGKSKSFLIIADINVYGSDDVACTDLIKGAVATTDVNKNTAYRMTDGDAKSKWSGQSVMFDLGRCFDIDGLSLQGKGKCKVSIWCDKNNISETEVQLEADEIVYIENDGHGRYISIEATEGAIDIYEVKSIIPKKDADCQLAEVDYYEDGEWMVYDLGSTRIIDHIEPCYKVAYVSATNDFANEVQVSGHTEDIISGRYLRVLRTDGAVDIYTYQAPILNNKTGVAEYNTYQYLQNPFDSAIVAKYDTVGRLLEVKIDDTKNGAVNTDDAKNSNSKLMVWESVESAKPAMPSVDIEEYTPKSVYKELYVSKNGSDANDGSQNYPFATIERAQEEVRTLTEAMTGDIIVYVGEGRYNLEAPLEFTENDGGRGEYDVIYKGIGQNKPVISGGKPISGFVDDGNGIWQVYLPEFETVYELEVNGQSATLAHTENSVTADSFYAKDLGNTYDGIAFDASIVPVFSNPSEVFVHTVRSWMDVFLRAENIYQEGNLTKVDMLQPYFNMACDDDIMNSLHITTDLQYEFENAYELMDKPGEFYFDKNTKILYYIPRENENISSVYAEVPMLDTLVSVHGDGVESHIENLVFDGFQFRNSTDSMRYRFGFITAQAQTTKFGSYENCFVSGAIQLDYATNVTIENCDITATTKTAISLGEGVVDSSIQNNSICNVGEGAIAVGRPWHFNIDKAAESKKYPDCYGRKPAWASSGKAYHIFSNKTNDILTDILWSEWKSDQSDIIKGIKPWVILDLLKPYTIQSVELRFLSEQSKFEVLASNDVDFKTYVSLGKRTKPISSYNSGGRAGEKFRYIKIQKTVCEPFSIAAVAVRTPDEPFRSQVEELCVGNKIENNYIENTALLSRAAPAITCYHVIGTKINHNSIINSNYTGISLGWGWAFYPDSTSCRNNHVSGNYIHNFNMTASDGGGIYAMGPQTGTVIEQNYILQEEEPEQSYTNVGIYADMGLKYVTVRENVIDMSEKDVSNRHAIAFFYETNEDCYAHTNYGTYTTIYDGGVNSRIERLQKYDASNPLFEVQSIIDSSGSGK